VKDIARVLRCNASGHLPGRCKPEDAGHRLHNLVGLKSLCSKLAHRVGRLLRREWCFDAKFNRLIGQFF
jgi:hypothetical protein